MPSGLSSLLLPSKRQSGYRSAAALLDAAARLAARAGPGVLPGIRPDSPYPGTRPRKRAGPGADFWQFRPYQSGDRPQDIDWRRSARSDQVFIRQREWTGTRHVCLWCDPGAGMAFRSAGNLPEKRAAAQLFLAALAILAQKSGDIPVLLRPDAPPAKGRLDDLAAALLHLPIPGDAPARAMRSPLPETLPPGASLLAVASDFLFPPETFRDFLGRCARNGTHILALQILDPAEIRFPFRGRVVFEDSAATADAAAAPRIELARCEDSRAAYLARLAAHQSALEDACAAHDARLLRHATDTPPEDIMSALCHFTQGKA